MCVCSPDDDDDCSPFFFTSCKQKLHSVGGFHSHSVGAGSKIQKTKEYEWTKY